MLWIWTILSFKKPFEIIVGKGENACNPEYFLFPTMVSTLWGRKIIISMIFIMSSANAFNLDHSNFFLFGKELSKVDLGSNRERTIKLKRRREGIILKSPSGAYRLSKGLQSPKNTNVFMSDLPFINSNRIHKVFHRRRI